MGAIISIQQALKPWCVLFHPRGDCRIPENIFSKLAVCSVLALAEVNQSCSAFDASPPLTCSMLEIRHQAPYSLWREENQQSRGRVLLRDMASWVGMLSNLFCHVEPCQLSPCMLIMIDSVWRVPQPERLGITPSWDSINQHRCACRNNVPRPGPGTSPRVRSPDFAHARTVRRGRQPP